MFLFALYVPTDPARYTVTLAEVDTLESGHYYPLISQSKLLKRIKVEGDYIYPQCIRKGKKRICKPDGERYKFKSYHYIWIEDKAPAPSSG